MHLLPKDEHFFELFRRQAAYAVEAADTILAIADAESPDWQDVWRRVHEIENRGDTTTHECLTRLYQTFVTPFDPEDIHELSERLDDTLDALDEVVRTLHVVRPAKTPKAFPDFARLLRSGAAACAAAVEGLVSKKDVNPLLVEVHNIEDEADALYDSVTAALFETEQDALTLIKLKEIYDALEAAADTFEEAAHIIEQIALKNG